MKKCTECQTEIEDRSQGRRRLTCSRKCRDARTYRLELEAKEPVFANCIQCNKTFQVSKHQRKCCSVQCRKKRNAETAKQRYAEQMKTRPAYKFRQCDWCEQPIKLPYSSNSPNKYHPDCKTQARRARDRIKTVKRQGYRSNYLVTHEEIASRDNYTCQLCDQPVDMTLPRTSKFGATLDHRIPISKGGADTLDNLQLAHWVCNNRKSDRTDYAESR